MVLARTWPLAASFEWGPPDSDFTNWVLRNTGLAKDPSFLFFFFFSDHLPVKRNPVGGEILVCHFFGWL